MQYYATRDAATQSCSHHRRASFATGHSPAARRTNTKPGHRCRSAGSRKFAARLATPYQAKFWRRLPEVQGHDRRYYNPENKTPWVRSRREFDHKTLPRSAPSTNAGVGPSSHRMADRSDAPKARALGQRSIFLPLAPSRPQVEAYAPKSFAKTAFHTGSFAQFAKKLLHCGCSSASGKLPPVSRNQWSAHLCTVCGILSQTTQSY